MEAGDADIIEAKKLKADEPVEKAEVEVDGKKETEEKKEEENGKVTEDGVKEVCCFIFNFCVIHLNMILFL